MFLVVKDSFLLVLMPTVQKTLWTSSGLLPNHLVHFVKIVVEVTRRVARIWKRGGGGFFERVKKVQRTSTRIFIILESVSHGLSEI